MDKSINETAVFLVLCGIPESHDMHTRFLRLIYSGVANIFPVPVGALGDLEFHGMGALRFELTSQKKGGPHSLPKLRSLLSGGTS